MNARRIRRLLGVLILLLSVAMLLWGLWPVGYESLSIPVPPESLQLPTPTTLLLTWLVV
jgi:hypothetical protein